MHTADAERRDQWRARITGLPYALALTLGLSQLALGIMLFAAFQEFVTRELGASDAWPGYLLGCYGGARVASDLPAGALSDRRSRKFGVLLGSAVSLPAVVLVATVREPAAYLAFAAMLGIGSALIWPAAYAMAADLYPREVRATVVGALNVGQILGFGLGALIGAVLVDQHWQSMFATAAGVVLAAFAVTLLAVPSYRNHDADGAARLRPRDVAAIVSPQLALLGGLVLAATVSVTLVIPAIRVFGEDELGLTFSEVTAYLVPGILVAGALYLPAGWLADRAGRELPFIVAQGMVVAGALMIAETRSAPVASAGATLMFAGYVFAIPAWGAAVMDLAPEWSRGALIGLTVSLASLGLTIGPVVGGAITEAWDAPAAFRVSSGAAFATALAIGAYWLRFGGAGPPEPGPDGPR